MKVYIVNRVCDDEYGCTEVEAVFAKEAEAKAYVEQHQIQLDVWFNENGIPEYSYDEWEVE